MLSFLVKFRLNMVNMLNVKGSCCHQPKAGKAESGAPGRCIGTQEPDMAVKLVTLVGTGWTRDIIQLIFVK